MSSDTFLLPVFAPLVEVVRVGSRGTESAEAATAEKGKGYDDTGGEFSITSDVWLLQAVTKGSLAENWNDGFSVGE